MTGQVEFNSHMDAVVAACVNLVNVATPGEARGRRYDVPTADDLPDALTGALVPTTRAGRRTSTIRADSVDGLVTAARRLRTVFEAVDEGDYDSAATVVNELLSESGAHPQLSRHDDEPWHLHFHGREADPVVSWTASCTTGLAIVLGGEHADRLGVCSASSCDRVYVDTSRNGTRRFCSTNCQSRVKAAAYRERHA